MKAAEHVLAYAVCEQCAWRSSSADDLGPARAHALHFAHAVRTVREVRITRDDVPAGDGTVDLEPFREGFARMGAPRRE